MEVLLLDSNCGHPELQTFAESYQKRLADHGNRVKTYSLGELEINPCLGCSACMYRTPGRSVMEAIIARGNTADVYDYTEGDSAEKSYL